jgi:DNA-binding transcriptional regulator GbsR (MarR family)
MVIMEKKSAEKKEAAIALVTEAAGRLFEHWDYRAVVGRVWALLILSSKPMDAQQIQESLGISAGATSMSLKELQDLELVYRELHTGKRRFFYTAESDYWVIATRIYRERERTRLESVLNQIKEAESALEQLYVGEKDDGKLGYQIEQVHKLATMGDFVIGILDAVMERTKVELKAAKKWLTVSGKMMGGEPLSRIRRRLNANRLDRKRR